MSNELPDQLMDVKEAAAIIGVTVGRVRQLAAAGKLKGERLGGPERGLWVFRRADVVAYAARPRRAQSYLDTRRTSRRNRGQQWK